MEFHISKKFISPERVKQIFDDSFTKMPDWFKENQVCDTLVIIGVDSNDTDRILRSLLAVAGNKRTFVCGKRVTSSCIEIFGILLKEIISESNELKQIFDSIVNKLSVEGFKDNGHVDTLYRHLSMYYLEPSMRSNLKERYMLCGRLASSLSAVAGKFQSAPTIQ